MQKYGDLMYNNGNNLVFFIFGKTFKVSYYILLHRILKYFLMPSKCSTVR